MADPTVSFTIVDQSHSDQIDDNGKLSGVWRITFTTPSGIKSYIDMPDAYYTPQNVHAWISQKVATIEQVQALNGTPPVETSPVS